MDSRAEMAGDLLLGSVGLSSLFNTSSWTRSSFSSCLFSPKTPTWAEQLVPELSLWMAWSAGSFLLGSGVCCRWSSHAIQQECHPLHHNVQSILSPPVILPSLPGLASSLPGFVRPSVAIDLLFQSLSYSPPLLLPSQVLSALVPLDKKQNPKIGQNNGIERKNSRELRVKAESMHSFRVRPEFQICPPFPNEASFSSTNFRTKTSPLHLSFIPQALNDLKWLHTFFGRTTLHLFLLYWHSTTYSIILK